MSELFGVWSCPECGMAALEGRLCEECASTRRRGLLDGTTQRREDTMAELTEDRVREIVREEIQVMRFSGTVYEPPPVEPAEPPPTEHHAIGLLRFAAEMYFARLSAKPQDWLDRVERAILHYEEVFEANEHLGVPCTESERLRARGMALDHTGDFAAGNFQGLCNHLAGRAQNSPRDMRPEQTFEFVPRVGGSGQIHGGTPVTPKKG